MDMQSVKLVKISKKDWTLKVAFCFQVWFLNGIIPVKKGFWNASKYTFETAIAIRLHNGLQLSSL